MVHYRQSIFLFLFLVLGYNLSFAQEEWIKFKPTEGLAFSIDAPGEMVKSDKTLKTVVGELNVLTYAYQGVADDANYLYLINLVQYPDDTFPSDSTDLIGDFLDNAIESSAEKVNGQLIYSTPIENEFGKLFRIKYNDGDAIIKGKVFVRKDVFITLQVFTVESKSLNDEMNIFLDSFRMEF